MHTGTKNFPFIPFVINLAIPLILGAIGRFFSRESMETWFLTIHKPDFYPPVNLSVGIVIATYITVGFSAFLVWRRRKQISNYVGVISLYFVQLVLHLVWRLIYFNYRDLGLGFFVMCGLLFVIIINSIVFYRINKWAGIFCIPYIVWISFITYLTYTIYILN